MFGGLIILPLLFDVDLSGLDILKRVLQFSTVVGTNAVEHKLELTMLDGKVATALSDATTSSQCCSICGLNPKRMNQLEVALEISKDLQPISFQYGWSTLHAWMHGMLPVYIVQTKD